MRIFTPELTSRVPNMKHRQRLIKTLTSRPQKVWKKLTTGPKN